MKKIVLLMCLAFVYFAVGCKSEREKAYLLQAEVISTDAPKALIVVKHGEIPGLMPAMTMQYAVAEPKQIETLKPGDKITADFVGSEFKGHLEKSPW
jgi:Cu/Ag efflux protein CusF